MNLAPASSFIAFGTAARRSGTARPRSAVFAARNSASLASGRPGLRRGVF